VSTPEETINQSSIRDSGLEKKPETDFQDMSFDKINMSTIQNLLSNHFTDESDSPIDEESPADQKLIILEVADLEEGLKKACELFEVDENEIEHSILENTVSEVDGKKVELKRIEFSQKLIIGSPDLDIAEDKLSADLKIIFPKKPDGTKITFMDIIKLIREYGIKYGVKTDVVKASVEETLKNFAILQNIQIAAGKEPGPGKSSEIIESVLADADVEEMSNSRNYRKSINELLSMSSLEMIKEYAFPVYYVNKGDIIAKTTLPLEGQPGKNIFEEEIPPEMGQKLFEAGNNVKMNFTPDEVTYTAEQSGYIDCEGMTLTIVSPIWITEDEMVAYFIKLPFLNKTGIDTSQESVVELLKTEQIEFGIQNEKIESVIKRCKENISDLKAVVVANGTPAMDGTDARVELFFTESSQPGKVREDGSVDYRSLEHKDLVKNNQLLAVKYLPKEGEPGTTVRGKELSAEKRNDTKFAAFNNVKAVKSADKISYYSELDGKVNIVGDKGISVNVVYEVKGNVDYKTGNVEFNGDVKIGGSVLSGFSVTAEGNITIDGTVNQNVALKSNGNIDVKQGIVGKDDIKITARGDVSTRFLQGAHITAGGDVVIHEYILNSHIESKGFVITPPDEKKSSGKGSIIGSKVFAFKGVKANIIGSNTSTNTQIIAGWDFTKDMKLVDLKKALQYCNYEIENNSKTLRLGIYSMDKIKALLKKLPPAKQKPILEIFKKLNLLNKLRSQVLAKMKVVVDDSGDMSKDAFIVARDQLFPRVLVQLGEQKMKTEKILLKSKMKVAENEKGIDILDL